MAPTRSIWKLLDWGMFANTDKTVKPIVQQSKQRLGPSIIHSYSSPSPSERYSLMPVITGVEVEVNMKVRQSSFCLPQIYLTT
jgi:hypothetical protein